MPFIKTFAINHHQSITVTIDDHSNIVLHFFGDCQDDDRTYQIQNGAVREFLDIFRIYFKIRRMERSPSRLAKNFLTDLSRSLRLKKDIYEKSFHLGIASITITLVETLPDFPQKAYVLESLHTLIPKNLD